LPGIGTGPTRCPELLEWRTSAPGRATTVPRVRDIEVEPPRCVEIPSQQRWRRRSTGNAAFRDAVWAYISQSCNCKTNSACAIGATYGYPIGNWCTSSITSMNQLFLNRTTFNNDISNWNMSQVTDMDQMFYGASAFNQVMGSWDTSKVTVMGHMFCSASAFNQAVGSWDTSQVTSKGFLFYFASAFNQAVGSWNTSQVTDMDRMFRSASTK
jgi:surface protein